MKLSGDQRREFEEALAEAFPKEIDLSRMVSYGLSEQLATIAAGNTIRDIIFNLVDWAEAHDKTQELVIAAIKLNSSKVRLREIGSILLTPDQLNAIITQKLATDIVKPPSEMINPLGSKNRLYWTLTALLIFIIVSVGATIVWFMPKPQEPPTVYFVIDATAKMLPIFSDVRKAVQLSTSAVRKNSWVGLRVYGGNVSDFDDCQDTKQLIAPNLYDDASTKLDTVLADIVPNGQGSLTASVLDALDDISQQKRPAKLVVVTSGPDALCDPLADSILKSQSKRGTNDVEVLIVSIGEVTNQDSHILDSYARDFNGGHIHIATPSTLPLIVRTASYYDYGYNNGYWFNNVEITPTP